MFRFLTYNNRAFNPETKKVIPFNDASGEPYFITIKPAKSGEIAFKCIAVHHLFPEENRGQHNIFADVIDENGKRIQGITLRAKNINGQIVYATIDKGPNEPGTNFPMWSGDTLEVSIDGVNSDKVQNLHPRHPDDGVGNYIGHHSFYLLFQRTFPTTQPVPPTEPPVENPPVEEPVIYFTHKELDAIDNFPFEKIRKMTEPLRLK